MYEYQNGILGVHYDQWHAQDLSSDQVDGCFTSNVVCRRLGRVCFKKVFKVIGTRETAWRYKFTI